jgi:hypothetical protein
LLRKDEEIYGHDPHTHYYLGITCHAIADKLYAATTVDASVTHDRLYYVNEAIKYLSIRATAYYGNEFMEERWGSMLTLGSLYAMHLVRMKRLIMMSVIV